jgi:phosphotriesterase-related protein
LVDAHCHLWIAPQAGAQGPRLCEEAFAEAELRAFRDAGGTAVIDCQPGGAGRDGWVLARLAAATGVEVAAATGFHLASYYVEDSPYDGDPDRLIDMWVGELTVGLAEEPGLRASVVKSAWTGEGDDRERRLVAAAAEAAHRGGGALIVHTERGRGAEELAELLLAGPLEPGRVQISHLDKRPDEVLHLELARAGFTLGYDAFLRPRYRPLESSWPLLRALAAAGLSERATVGLDLVDPAMWSVKGGAGLPAIARSILPPLRAQVGEEAARAVTGGNAMRLLGRAEVAA